MQTYTFQRDDIRIDIYSKGAKGGGTIILEKDLRNNTDIYEIIRPFINPTMFVLKFEKSDYVEHTLESGDINTKTREVWNYTPVDPGLELNCCQIF